MSSYDEAKAELLYCGIDLNHEYPEGEYAVIVEAFKAADTALAEKDIDIGRLEMQNSDLAGHILGMTCNMCNNRERADCFDKKTELEQDNAEKDKELARLNAALDGYKYDSPAG